MPELRMKTDAVWQFTREAAAEEVILNDSAAEITSLAPDS
jgi:hypothetical protein